MLEIRTTNGDTYLVMGERVLRNRQRLKYLDCPVVLWVGSCNADGSGTRQTPIVGRHFCARFRSGLYVGGVIRQVKDSC